MAQDHHHHHDHGHGHHHHHGPPEGVVEAPLDAANQSLADALRTSFNILKWVMLGLVVWYAFSGVQCIDQNKEAVVFRFGRILPEVRPAGLSWAFPFPIDETVSFPTKKSNEIRILSHWPKVRAGAESDSLDKTRPAGGLAPGTDGSLLTSDAGLVHIQWVVTYRVTDLRKYVSVVADAGTDQIEALIQSLLESAAVREVAEHTAEDVTRAGSRDIAAAVRTQINAALEALDTGVEVVALDIPRSSVPGQTIDAFNQVTMAENEKQKSRNEADTYRTDVLNGAAGASWQKLITHRDDFTGEQQVGLIDRYESAKAAGKAGEASALLADIDAILENEAGGDAGEQIRKAKSYYTEVVQAVQGDLREYNAALAEYTRSPELFINRMWQATRERIMQNDGVIKHINGIPGEIRIEVPVDPQQRKIDEMNKLRKEREEYDYQGPQHLRAVMPEEP